MPLFFPTPGGRIFYTGLGHTIAAYSDPNFKQHIANALLTVSGTLAADCGVTKWNNFQKVTLDSDIYQAMKVQVAPDGNAYYVERPGNVKVIPNVAFEPARPHCWPHWQHAQFCLQSFQPLKNVLVLNFGKPRLQDL